MAEPKTFALVHGAWHGAWCWDELRPYLERAGHKTVAMDLPIENPEANFDDYAQTVIEALSDFENIVLVVHSRAGNVGPRVAARLALDRIVYLCSPLPLFKETAATEIMEQAPARNSTTFRAGITNESNGLTSFNPLLAAEVFYNECTAQQSTAATGQLRLQRANNYELALPSLPAIPSSYIYTRNDKVINQDYSQFVAREVLSVEPIEIEGDHSPFLSNPQQLAATLLSL